MIRFIWKRIKHRKWTTLIVLFAFISIFTLIPVGLNQSIESVAVIEDSIQQHGRGSYDILVRPADSRLSIEEQLNVVEENYIGDSSGGITIEEWERIKEDPAIEIAAPVASVGYFTGGEFFC